MSRSGGYKQALGPKRGSVRIVPFRSYNQKKRTMNYIYLVVTSTGYLRKTNQYGESIEPYYDWDEETSANYHLSLAGARARIEYELAMYKKDYPDGECPILLAGSMNLNMPMELSSIGKSYNSGSIIEPQAANSELWRGRNPLRPQ